MQTVDSFCTNYSKTKLSFDQANNFRQTEFPRNRTFRIYPPSQKQGGIPQSHNFGIGTIPNKSDLLVSNLPLTERARMQKYNIKCNAQNYDLMMQSIKYIFDAYSFNFETNHNQFCKTHYFSIAPNLQDQTPGIHLPNIFRTSICQEIDNPKHFSFSTYAIVGGYSDGFYFMSRLDNNTNEFAHICHNAHQSKNAQFQQNGKRSRPATEVIAFPHMHQPSFTHDKHVKQEFCTPYHLPQLSGKNIRTCLDYYIKQHNISSNMMLVQEDMRIDQVISIAKNFDIQADQSSFELGSLGKIALINLGQYESSTQNAPHYGRPAPQESGAPYLRPA